MKKWGVPHLNRHTEHQMRLRLGNLHHTIYESQQEGSTYPINLIQADNKSPRTDSLDFTPCALVIYFLLFLYYIILSCNSSSFIIITYEKGWVVIVIIWFSLKCFVNALSSLMRDLCKTLMFNLCLYVVGCNDNMGVDSML